MARRPWPPASRKSTGNALSGRWGAAAAAAVVGELARGRAGWPIIVRTLSPGLIELVDQVADPGVVTPTPGWTPASADGVDHQIDAGHRRQGAVIGVVGDRLGLVGEARGRDALEQLHIASQPSVFSGCRRRTARRRCDEAVAARRRSVHVLSARVGVVAVAVVALLAGWTKPSPQLGWCRRWCTRRC